MRQNLSTIAYRRPPCWPAPETAFASHSRRCFRSATVWYLCGAN